MLCTEIVSDIQNNFCTHHVLPMFCKKKSFWQRFTCKDEKSSKWCPNATALFYYQPCYGTCGLLQTEISQIKCPSNPDYCMDKGKNKSIIGLVLLALKWSGWAEVSAINWEPCKVEDLNFSPLKELLREKEWQFICVNLYALDLSAHYGNTSCGLFKRGVQN